MAQSTEVRSSSNARMKVDAKSLAVAGTGALATLLEVLSLAGIRRFWAEIKPTVNAFTAFQVQAKFHPDGGYITIASVAADFTSPGGVIVGASGDLTILAAGATGWLSVDVAGMHALRLRFTGASGTLVDVYAGASS